ncbi:hypothetical protein BD769DRAFT_1680255 [Suillus cothurnatus]|nr:hypothetical protein BD769DRAFT_1680255 [Suillus cothurnatus]
MSTLPPNSSSTPSSFYSTRALYKKQPTVMSWRSSKLRELEPPAVVEGNLAAQTINIKTTTPRIQYMAALAASMNLFQEFSGIRPQEYELLVHFLEESRLKPKLSYLAEEYILIVEMPSAVHEAPLVSFHAAFTCFFGSIDFNRSLLNDMSDTNKKVYVSVLGETSLSQNWRTLLKKFRNTIKLNPGLLMAIMAEIDETTGYHSPKKKSCVMTMLWEMLPCSSDDFNDATGTLPARNNPVKVEGHTWCSICSVRFKVWVRGVEPIDLDTTDKSLVVCGTLYPIEDMVALHAMIQKGICAIGEQLITVYQSINPHADANSMRVPPFILCNDEIVTKIAGAMSETAHHHYMAWYTEQHVIELTKHHTHAA